MAKTATYYFDKASGIVSLHNYDRTCANQLAEGFGESVGKFMGLLTNTIYLLQNNGKISITINNEDKCDEPSDEGLKCIKHMVDEYDQLTERYHKFLDFFVSDKFGTLPESKRMMFYRYGNAMQEYREALRERIIIEAKEANLNIDSEDGTE